MSGVVIKSSDSFDWSAGASGSTFKASAFQPYVGAGVNFTWFFDESLSGTAKSAGFDGLSRS